MDVTAVPDLPTDCGGVSEVLARVGERWSVQVVVVLATHPRRFNDIRRAIAGISQQMLTRTLKALERDGLVDRCVHDSTPPQVEYSLTERGASLAWPLSLLAQWAIDNRDAIRDSRHAYDARTG